MEVHEGRVGRVFAVRLKKGDHLIGSLNRLAEERGIRTALVLVLGATAEARMVLGVRPQAAGPPGFDRLTSAEHREVIGVGSITVQGGKPKVHLHVATGRDRQALIAHIEEAETPGMEVFLVECLGADLASASLL